MRTETNNNSTTRTRKTSIQSQLFWMCLKVFIAAIPIFLLVVAMYFWYYTAVAQYGVWMVKGFIALVVGISCIFIAGALDKWKAIQAEVEME